MSFAGTVEDFEREAKVRAADERRRDEELLRLGRRAEELLADPLLADAFKVLEEHWLRALRHFDVSKPEQAIEARIRLETLDQVKRELQEVMTTGKLVSRKRELDRGGV